MKINHAVKFFLAMGVVLITLMLSPLIASAHVHIDPSTAQQGSTGTFSFEVPNEEEDANTIKVQVQLPGAYPIATVEALDADGWSHTEKKLTPVNPVLDADGNEVSEVVSEITWEGGTIAPEKKQQFRVTMGPLTDKTDQLVFKVLQTYSNGDVVRWIEETTADGVEPEFPAPTLTLTKSSETSTTQESHHHEEAKPVTTQVQAKDDDSVNPWIVVAIVVGAAALVLAIVALVKMKKSKAPADDAEVQSTEEESPEINASDDTPKE